MKEKDLFFEQIRSSGCLSYLLGCKKDKVCLETLGDEVRVYPAHDYRPALSTLGDEKKNNPRLLMRSREEFIKFMTSRNPPLPRKIQSALEWNRTPIQGTQRGKGEGI